ENIGFVLGGALFCRLVGALNLLLAGMVADIDPSVRQMLVLCPGLKVAALHIGALPEEQDHEEHGIVILGPLADGRFEHLDPFCQARTVGAASLFAHLLVVLIAPEGLIWRHP